MESLWKEVARSLIQGSRSCLSHTCYGNEVEAGTVIMSIVSSAFFECWIPKGWGPLSSPASEEYKSLLLSLRDPVKSKREGGGE